MAVTRHMISQCTITMPDSIELSTRYEDPRVLMKFVMDSLKAKTTVVDGSTTPPYTLRESSDYTIDYLSIGKTEANVIIAGNGEYTGSVDRTVRLVSTAPAGPSMPAKGRGQGLGDTIYTAVKRALGEPASEEAFGSSYGLGDTIYTAIKKAMAGKGGGQGGGGGSSTQTLTVTKSAASDTVSVHTVSWADYIADNDPVEVQPDSTDGLVSVYSIPVGAFFDVSINNDAAVMYLDADMTVGIRTLAMPSTPLYAKSRDK